MMWRDVMWCDIALTFVIRYLISLSGALALLNVVPCYALDGQWILLALTEVLLKPVVASSEVRAAVNVTVLLFGTCLLSTTILIALWSLFV